MRIILLTMLMLATIQDEIIGKWITSEKDLLIECYKKDKKYYAKIIWFKDENPNIKKYSEEGIHKSKWIGYTVMKDFEFKETYWEGTIYDIKKGKEYLASLHKKEEHLELKIYLLFIPVKTIIFEKYRH